MKIDHDEWDTTRCLAARFRVSIATVNQWRIMKGFPDNAVRKHEGRLQWHVPTVRRWYDARPGIRMRNWRVEHDERLAAQLDFSA